MKLKIEMSSFLKSTIKEKYITVTNLTLFPNVSQPFPVSNVSAKIIASFISQSFVPWLTTLIFFSFEGKSEQGQGEE